jgi:hypothetical protein
MKNIGSYSYTRYTEVHVATAKFRAQFMLSYKPTSCQNNTFKIQIKFRLVLSSYLLVFYQYFNFKDRCYRFMQPCILACRHMGKIQHYAMPQVLFSCHREIIDVGSYVRSFLCWNLWTIDCKHFLKRRT